MRPSNIMPRLGNNVSARRDDTVMARLANNVMTRLDGAISSRTMASNDGPVEPGHDAAGV
jgi:hypothetical protein